MALRQSKGARNFKLQFGSLKQALQNGEIRIFTGTQPASADDAETGTLLVKLTNNGGARTPEVLASGSIELTGGGSGSVNTVTVNSVNIIPQGAVPFNGSLNQTAVDLAAAINQGLSSPEYTASAAAAVVTIKALRGTGVAPNGFVVASTLTTITASHVNMAGGVAPVNGLQLGSSLAGVLSKLVSQVWKGTAVASGTAGWYRHVGSVADAGGADVSESEIRIDGNIASSGANMNMTNTSVTNGADQTLSSFSLTDPAA